MTAYEETLVRPEVVAGEQGDPLHEAVTAAIESGVLDLEYVDGAESIETADVAEAVARFASLASLFSTLGEGFPCAFVDRGWVPLDILSEIEAAADPGTMEIDAARLRKIVQAAFAEYAKSGTATGMEPIEQAKASIISRLLKFLRKRIETEAVEDFHGLEVTVVCRSSGLKVLWSPYFLLRQGVTFGDTLSTPVIGHLRNAGFYYFGATGGAPAAPFWDDAAYEIPPSFKVNLLI